MPTPEAAIGMVADIAIDKEVAIAIDLDDIYGIAGLLWSFARRTDTANPGFLHGSVHAPRIGPLLVF